MRLARTPYVPKGQTLEEKPGALSAHQRLIRQRGVTPLMYQYGETVSNQRERMPCVTVGSL